ncbi:thioredoxin family protein [bacterium]|nr:thioredoxin family protein [bacterium]
MKFDKLIRFLYNNKTASGGIYVIQMFHMKLLFLLFVLASISFAKSVNKDPYRFSNYSFTQSKLQNKLIFLFIGSDVCIESKNFLKEIANDDEYFQLVKDNFLFKILDYDLNPSLSNRYSLPTIPGFLILDHQGTIFLGSTKPDKEKIYPILQKIVKEFQEDPQTLKDDLKEFQKTYQPKIYDSTRDIIDSTMNVPNHISLDLGRYILSLNKKSYQFLDYKDQLKAWIKSENFDFVEGNFFMPRGYCTYHAEGKYSFFNFKLQEMLIDFYFKTKDVTFKYAFLKSLKYLKRDLFLSFRKSYSIGYASKKYFRMNLKERLKYFPPSPRRSDLALSQVIYLKILYKIELLLKRNLIYPNEISFLKDHLDNKLPVFSNLLKRYQREDGLLYFTSQKDFTNFETQIELFSLLQLMEISEKTDSGKFLDKMTQLYDHFYEIFYDKKRDLFMDIPKSIFYKNKRVYLYPLYFVREHARLFQLLDYLYLKTKDSKYKEQIVTSKEKISQHSEKYPQRFYWLKWYDNLLKNKKRRKKR